MTPFTKLKTYGAFARRYAQRLLEERRTEAATPILSAPHKPLPMTWRNDEITFSWLGHATVLINFLGTWILTDPVFSTRVGVNLGVTTLGPKRLVQPALTAREIPKLDLILLSHAHMDHTDLPSLARLPRQTPVVCAARNRDLVRRFRHVSELEWNQTFETKDLRVTALEVKHWGARTLNDTWRGYNAYLIEKNNHAILFGGDTAYTIAFRRLRTAAAAAAARPQGIDLAIMPIGAYDPYIAVHASPEQAWQMSDEMNAHKLLPIHHSTFKLSREPVDEPLQRLYRAAGTQAASRIVDTSIGATNQIKKA